jgi:hypothetical protein
MGKNKKKLFAYLISLLLIGGVLFLVISIFRNVTVLSLDSPANLSVYTLDGVRVKLNFDTKDTTLLFVFNPDCDLCIIEFNELLESYHLFKDFEIYLLADQEISVLREFVKANDLNHYPNINVVKIDESDTDDQFINSPNPSVFAYKKGNKLIYFKKGYSNPKMLLNELRKGHED